MKFAAGILAVTDFAEDVIRFSDALAVIKQCGFDQVMLLSGRDRGPVLRRGVTPDGAFVDLVASDLDVVAGQLQRAGLEPKVVFAAGIDTTTPEMAEVSAKWLLAMSKAAMRLGSRYVGHNCGRAETSGMDVARKQDDIKRLAEVVDEVAGAMPMIHYGVDIHYHGTIESVADCEYYLEQLSCKNAGLLMNMGHLTTCQQPGWELVRNYPDRTPIIAWKDHFAGTDRPRPAASFQLGTADAPFEKYAQVIKPQTTDRAHVISIEGLPEAERVDALRASRLYIEDLWDRT